MGVQVILVKGASVYAEDQRFGLLVDLVVDPLTHAVSHLVVDPGGSHLQARLVPVWLVQPAESGLRIALPASHVRQLQRALESDFVRLAAETATLDQIDRFKTVLTLPHFEDPGVVSATVIDRDLLPPWSECEIRRSSWVVGSADKVLGAVAGFILDGDRVHSIIVRAGVPGHRQNAAVPITAVSQVSSHIVKLTMDRHAFRALPEISTVVARSANARQFRPRELWQEVLGRPSNKLWDDFEVDGTPEHP